jgi:hypothetical protein
MRNRYREIWQSVNRPGTNELLDWLDGTDFYTAPCSTRHHLAREGGLVEHSLNVYDYLCLKVDPDDTAKIVALGHDLCKADYYGQEMRNVKENGVWIKKPYYTVKDKLPYGHGEKSVLLLQRFIKLKTEEVMAIRWHMGGFTPGMSDYSMNQAFSEAAKRYPLIILLHAADMEATYIKEVEK